MPKIIGTAKSDLIYGYYINTGSLLTIQAGDGNDQIFGSLNINSLLEGGDGDDIIVSGYQTNTLRGGAGNDTLLASLAKRSTLDGGSGNDTIVGGYGVDQIKGGSGADNITAGDGDDVLFGGSGSDLIDGGYGNDTLTGGTGRDILRGGSDDDAFIFESVSDTGRSATSRDIILDFTRGLLGYDYIDLRKIDANSGTVKNDAFLFRSKDGAALSGVAGELVWKTVKSDGYDKVFVVTGDVDGDKAADFSLEINARHIDGLLKSDFFL